MTIDIRGPILGTASRCEPVLSALPDWFGIDSAVQAYAQAIDTLPTFMAEQDTDCVGFVTIKPHNPRAAELYVLGVRCELHRRGIGRRLLAAAETWMHSTGIAYTYVKIIGPSRRSEPYDRTRQFYLAMGYCPLEEFKSFWAHDPCQIMVKHLGCASVGQG